MIQRLKHWPRWLWLLLAVWVVKNSLVASVGPPWYAEDEPSHFGYIEALARMDTWYSFADNYASVEMRTAQKWWNTAQNREVVLDYLNQEENRQYRSLASPHKNATAYQPPLFYYLLSRIYRVLPVNMVTILYVLRLVNVLIGGLYILTVYLIARTVFRSERHQLATTGLTGFLPLLSLISAGVTVQVFVFWLYGLLILALIKARQRPIFWYLTAGVTSGVGLLTQQALFAAPLITLAMLSIDKWKGKIGWREWWVVIGLLAVIGGLVWPQLWRRHTETSYTVTQGQVELSRYRWYHYLPGEWERLQREVIAGFWDQKRSLVPFYASERGERIMKVMVALAGVGIYRGWTAGVGVRLREERRRFLLLAGLAGTMFVAAHLVIDYLQIRYTGQEYLKARYFYPLLPFIGVGLIAGLTRLSNNRQLQRGLVLFMIALVVILNITATSWLMIAIGRR